MDNEEMALTPMKLKKNNLSGGKKSRKRTFRKISN